MSTQKDKKYGVKTFDCSHCYKKFGLLLWQEFLKFEGMKFEDTKSMVSKLLVALLNSLSHTWQWKRPKHLFQVRYFMLYRMVSPKMLCNWPANQYHRQISLRGFFHDTSEKTQFFINWLVFSWQIRFEVAIVHLPSWFLC